MAKILVVGDLLRDVYVDIEPAVRCVNERPIPKIDGNGAPAYKIHHIAEQLGGAAAVAQMLRVLGGDVTYADTHHESVKTRYQWAGQTLWRLDDDSYVGPLSALAAARQHPGPWDAVVISDYGKCAVTPDVIQWATCQSSLVIADPYPGMSPGFYAGCCCITPNRTAFQSVRCGCWVEDFPWVAAKFDVDGAALWKHGVLVRPYRAVNVGPFVDSCGAGDQFVAALAHFWSAGEPVERAVELANLAAGIKCTRRGTVPTTPQEIAAACERLRSVA